MKIKRIEDLYEFAKKHDLEPFFTLGGIWQNGEVPEGHDVDVILLDKGETPIWENEVENIHVLDQEAPSTYNFFLVEKSSKVVPFKLVEVIRPAKRAFALKDQAFSIDQLMELIPKDCPALYVSWKADGMRTQLHKVGDRVELLSDEAHGIDPAKVAPIIEEARKSLPHAVILDGELMGYLNGKQRLREEFVGWIHSKEKPTEAQLKGIRYKPFDILWLEGKDLTDLPFIQRYNIWKKVVKKTAHIHPIIHTWIKAPITKEKLERAIKKVTSQEGVVIRDARQKYFDSHLMWKLKWQFEVDLLVVKKETTKGGAWVFTVATREGYIVGKTYGQRIVNANVGDVIRIAVDHVTRRVINGREVFSFYSPKPRDIKKAGKGEKSPKSKYEVGERIDVSHFANRKYADSIEALRKIWEVQENKREG